MKNIIVIATLTLKESANSRDLAVITTLHSQTHQNDKGCLQYDVHKDTQKENTYVFVETWESETLLTEHTNKEHFKKFQEALEAKIESLDIKILEKIL